jgi:creatinine amidohydrolase/Fe(II)-dependent formamide hydrolase-like protein
MRAGFALCLALALLPLCAQAQSRLQSHAYGDSVWMEDLTWVELKAKIDAGHTSVILPTGGVEQNGPYITLGKHNHVVGYAAKEIAAALGQTLVAPVLKVVPQGSMDKPSGNLLFPGTMALREDTFDRVLQDMVLSLAYAGFKRVYLMGDHGQSQAIQHQVAQRMAGMLQAAGVRVLHVQSYYQPDLEEAYLLRQGVPQAVQGEHAGVSDTAQIWAVQPDAVRQAALLARDRQQPAAQGMSGRPELATPELGRELLKLRIKAAVDEIRRFDK